MSNGYAWFSDLRIRTPARYQGATWNVRGEILATDAQPEHRNKNRMVLVRFDNPRGDHSMRSFFQAFVVVAVAGGCSSGTALKQEDEAGARGDGVGISDHATRSPDAQKEREDTAAKGDDARADVPVQAGPEVQADTGHDGAADQSRVGDGGRRVRRTGRHRWRRGYRRIRPARAARLAPAA